MIHALTEILVAVGASVFIAIMVVGAGTSLEGDASSRCSVLDAIPRETPPMLPHAAT